MAGKFVRASSQYLINSAPALPSTGYPLTIGAWFTQDAIAAIEAIVTYSNSAAGKFGIMTLQVSATGQITAGNAPDAGGTNGATTTGTISTGTWNFAVARLITATNRKLAALFSTGVSEHASNVTGTAPTGLNNITIGCRNVNASPANFHGGMIGEGPPLPYWFVRLGQTMRNLII